MNKKGFTYILLIAVFVIIIGIGYFFFFSKTHKSINQNNNFFEGIKSSLSCAKEGESVGTCVGCVSKCCNGLKGMANLKYGTECIKLQAPGSGAVCSKCGNGICDIQNNEDKCNCPEDCK